MNSSAELGTRSGGGIRWLRCPHCKNTSPTRERGLRAHHESSSRSRVGLVLRFALVGIVLISSQTAFSQDNPAKEKRVEIEQAGMQPTIQTGRPIPSWWDVKVKGSVMVEGRFEFVLMHDGRVLASFTTEELALTGPQQRIRVLLPPVDDPYGIDQLQVEATFRGKKFTEKLGLHVLRVAMARSRTFMMLTSTSRLAAKRSAERDRVRKRLAFESMATANLEDSVLTIPTLLEPNDLPQEPMAYCAYDLVVLFGDEFRAIKKPQLDALTAWIRAGGSFYVEPTGVLEPYHIDFLRGLTAGDSRGLIFQPDSSGRLIPGTVWEDERIVSTTTNGFGRVAIRVEEEEAATDPNTNFESEVWRRATAFLWRLRTEQIEAVAKDGQFDLGLIVAKNPQQMIDTNGDGIPDTVPPNSNSGRAIIRGGGRSLPAMPQGWLSWKLPTSTGVLLDRLMPEGVRMVPLWLLGFILLSFVVVIGPVDYIGLGWLKARKYTWLLFPLATIAVTGLTVWVSNSYMSSAEARRGLVIRDVGDDGSIVRTNRFELLFIAASRSVTTEVRKGVFSPLGTGGSMAGNSAAIYQQQLMQQQFMQQQMRSGRPGGSFRGSDELSSAKNPPRIEGRIPTQFEVTQDLAKWTPQLNRMFWIPGSADEQSVDWKAMTEGLITTEMLDSHTMSGELTDRVRKQFGKQALVACLGPNGRWAHDRNPVWSSHQNQVENPYMNQQRILYSQVQDYTNVQLPAEIQQQGDLFRWLYQHSVALPRGLFALASHIGPKGGPELDDLPIYDPSDTEHALLIVVVPVGDDFVVYRKLVSRCIWPCTLPATSK